MADEYQPPGPLIGKLAALARQKTHSTYRGSKRVQVVTLRHPMPGRSGFLWLEGVAVHHSLEHRLVVTVSSRRRPDNLGPGIFLRETVEDWDRERTARGEARAEVARILEDVAERVRKREFPVTDMHMERCNTAGQSPATFLEGTCTGCRCWYCELSAP